MILWVLCALDTAGGILLGWYVWRGRRREALERETLRGNLPEHLALVIRRAARAELKDYIGELREQGELP
jgi:uncharacterized iron-regulated membrane protein